MNESDLIQANVLSGLERQGGREREETVEPDKQSHCLIYVSIEVSLKIKTKKQYFSEMQWAGAKLESFDFHLERKDLRRA